MHHFWLEPEQQLIMDAATQTASQYGFVAIMKLDSKEDINFREVTSKPFPATEYMTSYSLARVRRTDTRFNAVFRLTKDQALLFKQTYAGTGDGVLIPDPTGECWGNMSICRAGISTALASASCKKRHKLPLTQFHKEEARHTYILATAGQMFGPTIATVSDRCKGLPLSWAKPFVWAHAHVWSFAGTPVSVPETQIVGNDLFTIERGGFSAPTELVVQKWARGWYNKMQLVKNRQAYGIIDVPYDTIL